MDHFTSRHSIKTRGSWHYLEGKTTQNQLHGGWGFLLSSFRIFFFGNTCSSLFTKLHRPLQQLLKLLQIAIEWLIRPLSVANGFRKAAQRELIGLHCHSDRFFQLIQRCHVTVQRCRRSRDSAYGPGRFQLSTIGVRCGRR